MKQCRTLPRYTDACFCPFQIFTPHCMTNYLMLFNALWRAKRMEFVLSGVWKRQALLAKMTRSECHSAGEGLTG